MYDKAQGKIASFDPKTKRGVILTSDGRKFAFDLSNDRISCDVDIRKDLSVTVGFDQKKGEVTDIQAINIQDGF